MSHHSQNENFTTRGAWIGLIAYLILFLIIAVTFY